VQDMSNFVIRQQETGF